MEAVEDQLHEHDGEQGAAHPGHQPTGQRSAEIAGNGHADAAEGHERKPGQAEDPVAQPRVQPSGRERNQDARELKQAEKQSELDEVDPQRVHDERPQSPPKLWYCSPSTSLMATMMARNSQGWDVICRCLPFAAGRGPARPPARPGQRGSRVAMMTQDRSPASFNRHPRCAAEPIRLHGGAFGSSRTVRTLRSIRRRARSPVPGPQVTQEVPSWVAVRSSFMIAN